jgi:hypothetical protein
MGGGAGGLNPTTLCSAEHYSGLLSAITVPRPALPCLTEVAGHTAGLPACRQWGRRLGPGVACGRAGSPGEGRIPIARALAVVQHAALMQTVTPLPQATPGHCPSSEPPWRSGCMDLPPSFPRHPKGAVCAGGHSAPAGLGGLGRHGQHLCQPRGRPHGCGGAYSSLIHA